MLNAYSILEAVGEVREDYVRDTAEFLQVGEAARAHRHIRLWRTLLIAAVLTALFTATAYAAGWFGIGQRSIETEIPEPAWLEPDQEKPQTYHWVSLNGFKDSPEYKANAEWLAFWHNYTGTHTITNDVSWQEELDKSEVDTCHFYGVYDAEMLQKLREIADAYGLRLHTDQVSPNTLRDFYRCAGTGAFLPEGTGLGYIYEDGSFKLEADVLTGPAYVEEGQLVQPGFGLTILKNLSGTILPMWHGMDEPEQYREWEYTNRFGDTVLMSYNSHRDDLRIFFDLDGVFVEVSGYSLAGAFADDTEMERLADCVVFHELLKTAPDFSVVRRGPTVCEEPGTALSLSDFLRTQEGMALKEKLAYLNGEAPPQDPKQNEEGQRSIAEKYGLKPEGKTMAVCSQAVIDAKWYEDFTCIPLEFYQGLIPKAVDQELGPDHFLVMDNGVICFWAGIEWQYIPKGALGDWMEGTLDEEYPDGWFYRTACGVVVYIAADLSSPQGKRPVILYTAPNGWVIGKPNYYHSAYEPESWADCVDFTVFK